MCTKCPDGQFSNFLTINKDWTIWPSQTATRCTNQYYPCQPWRLQGKYIDSGKNYDTVMSEFTYSIEVS